VRWMCEALGVSRAGFYAWLTRPPNDRAVYDHAFAQAIRSIYLTSDRTYRSRCVSRDMLAAELDCGRQLVECLMHSLALQAGQCRRRLPVDARGHDQRAGHGRADDDDPAGPL
jgi:putative transposase